MRYFVALVLFAIGLVPYALEGDGTLFLVTVPLAVTLIFCEANWLKGPYEEEPSDDEWLASPIKSDDICSQETLRRIQKATKDYNQTVIMHSCAYDILQNHGAFRGKEN